MWVSCSVLGKGMLGWNPVGGGDERGQEGAPGALALVDDPSQGMRWAGRRKGHTTGAAVLAWGQTSQALSRVLAE